MPLGRIFVAVEAAVVCIVKTVVALPLDKIGTLVGFRLQVGRLCAPAGELVRVQVRFSVPENVLPAERVAVVVALFPAETGEGAGAAITRGAIVMLVVALVVP